MHGATNISVAAMQIPFAGIKLNECFCCIYCYSFFPIHCWGVQCSEQEEKKLCFVSFHIVAAKGNSNFPSDLYGALYSVRSIENVTRFNVTAWHAICNKHSYVVLTSIEINIYNRITCTFT